MEEGPKYFYTVSTSFLHDKMIYNIMMKFLKQKKNIFPMIPDNLFLIIVVRSSDYFLFSLFNGPFLVALEHNLYLLVHSTGSDSQHGACDPDVCCSNIC